MDYDQFCEKYGMSRASTPIWESEYKLLAHVVPENEIIFKCLLHRARTKKPTGSWETLLKDWKNPALHFYHFIFVRKFENFCEDDNIYLDQFESLAYIEDHHGVRKWMDGGVVHRNQRDANGRLLPAEISSRACVWRRGGKLHRAELDKNTKKALPALIIYDKNGDVEEEQFFWRDERMSQEEMANKIEEALLKYEQTL